MACGLFLVFSNNEYDFNYELHVRGFDHGWQCHGIPIVNRN